MIDKPFPWMLNRRVAAMEPEFLGGEELTKRWVVCDRFSPPRAPAESEDPRGNPMTYGCEDMLLTVTESDIGTWVVCNDWGQFLRTTGWAGDNRRIRRFKSPQAAAAFAETVPEFERHQPLTAEHIALGWQPNTGINPLPGGTVHLLHPTCVQPSMAADGVNWHRTDIIIGWKEEVPIPAPEPVSNKPDAWRVGDDKSARYFEGDDAEERARLSDDARDGYPVRPVWFGVAA